jgi:hypothetical protein
MEKRRIDWTKPKKGLIHPSVNRFSKLLTKTTGWDACGGF